MYEVAERIEKQDGPSTAIGIDLVESDQHLPFGKGVKSNTARALRRTSLTEYQKSRLRKRLVFMLVAGNIPHEFREYSKLLRTIGVAEYCPKNMPAFRAIIPSQCGSITVSCKTISSAVQPPR